MVVVGGGGVLQTGWYPLSDAAWETSDRLTAGLTAMLVMLFTAWNVTDGQAVQQFVWNSCLNIRFEWEEPNSVWFLSCWTREMTCQVVIFSGSCIDFIKHYYSWHSCEKIEIEAVWIFIFKKDMNEPNDLYNFVP